MLACATLGECGANFLLHRVGAHRRQAQRIESGHGRAEPAAGLGAQFLVACPE